MKTTTSLILCAIFLIGSLITLEQELLTATMILMGYALLTLSLHRIFKVD